ncbi:MAG TPA: kynureninase [Steroidobacteraceae bacterium]|jgi:kynureninase|nr:kynureninase [Steroidobacteraceae bacterium]
MNLTTRIGPAALQSQLDWARSQDAADALAPLRARFALPRGADGRPLLYFCGHSLGLAPMAARAMIEAEIAHWERLGALGHEHAASAWIGYAEALQLPLAQLAGAQVHEVVAMNSLSVNLHLLLASFYRPSDRRRAILIEAGAFSSDRHAVASQIGWHGFDPKRELIELAPRDGEDLIRIEDVEARIAAEGPRLALVLWPGAQYRTGQLFDLARITRAAHAADCMVGFDLAHSIGNVPLALHADDADFAVWCSYKYLNAGPGALGGAFVHERHLPGSELPRLTGWWGHDPGTRFEMRPEFVAARGAAAWALSNPPIFSAAPLRASLPLFTEAGMPALRRKSIALTAYLASLLTELAGEQLAIITPADPAQRGSQLSLRIARGAGHGRELFKTLSARGVVCDWREPDIIRIAPVPLYNGFEDVLRGAWQLCELLQQWR